MDDLRAKVADKRYAGRRKIGAFSAASNVSGVKTPCTRLRGSSTENGALAFFDFAAAAPYEPIDMGRDAVSFFDALYFSPHKFLGGPGSCGVLIFHQRDLPRRSSPDGGRRGARWISSGFDGQAYSTDIEVREKAGTPGILQTLRAALAMELKEMLGPARIAAREAELTRRAFNELCRAPRHRADGGRRAGAPPAHLLLQRPRGLVLAAPALRHHAS